VSVAYSPNRFSQIAQNSQSPEKILLYDKGNAPGGLVQHAPKLPPHTRKTFRWLAEGQPQLERCRFGRVSFARQLVELGQSRPVAGVRLAFSQPGILAVTGPGALPQATVSLAFGQKTGDAEPCAKTCPITADVRSPSTTSIQKNRTVLLSAGDTGGRLSGGAGRIRLEPAAGRGSADGGNVPPDPTCAWHLLLIRFCWPKANFTVAWGNAPGGVVVATHPNQPPRTQTSSCGWLKANLNPTWRC
jgi:hypothetical protein